MTATTASRLVIGFACAGHASMHVLTGLYLTLALVIERAWQQPYDELIGLWTLGAMMIGLGAPVAGWLSDRFGERPLMVAFFLATGAGSVLTGLADDGNRLWIGLACLGLGASIYHPVALSWVVKYTAIRRGSVLGLWGLCGSFGVATASIIAGTLADLWSWQAAFILPGLIVIAIGVALLVLPPLLAPARRADGDTGDAARVGRGTMMRAFAALTTAMFIGGIFYAAYTTMLPKWLNLTLFGGTPNGLDAASLGAVVTLVYLSGSSAQIIGGYLTDRVALKWLYVGSFVVKLPMPFIAAAVGGLPAAIVAGATMFFMEIGAPVENVLVARYAPDGRQGLVYGLKFVLLFASGPIGVQLVARFYSADGDFNGLLMLLGAMVAVMLTAALMLPADRRPVLSAPAPA